VNQPAASGQLFAALFLAACSVTSCSTVTERSRSQRDAFQRMNPCPANGVTRGACPGFVVDHIEPLCAGGADVPANMQWQTVDDAKSKDREEVRQCRAR
jgi:hypothetical protein